MKEKLIKKVKTEDFAERMGKKDIRTNEIKINRHKKIDEGRNIEDIF